MLLSPGSIYVTLSRQCKRKTLPCHCPLNLIQFKS